MRAQLRIRIEPAAGVVEVDVTGAIEAGVVGRAELVADARVRVVGGARWNAASADARSPRTSRWTLRTCCALMIAITRYASASGRWRIGSLPNGACSQSCGGFRCQAVKRAGSAAAPRRDSHLGRRYDDHRCGRRVGPVHGRRFPAAAT
jgi:hypothetical protein